MSEQWERLRELESQIMLAVPPIDPPTCHWLNSDSSESYCLQHAWEACWARFPTIGAAPPIPDWWSRTDFERTIAEDIDGCYGGGSESDHSEHCSVCGCTLKYLLTDYGLQDELAHFAEHPVMPGDVINGEVTYALDRIFINQTQFCSDPEIVAACIIIAEGTLSAIAQVPA